MPRRTALKRRSVLVTGAAGNIGSYFARHSHKRYELRLMVQAIDAEARKLRSFGRLVVGDLDDLERLKELCAGVDTVLHLAASAGPSAVWSEVLQNNIIGSYNLFVAAKSAGCRRVVFASSIHVVSGYPDDVQVKTSEPVNPGDLYGVSKCFGEALGRYMAEQENLSVICLRIGAFQPPEATQGEVGLSMLDAWVSQRDLNQLIEKSIDAENLPFGIFHALSDNRFKRLDITSARDILGYAPLDDFTEINAQLRPLRLGDKIASHSMRDSRQQSGLRDDLSPAARRAAHRTRK